MDKKYSVYAVEETLNALPQKKTKGSAGQYEELKKIIDGMEPEKNFYEELEEWLVKRRFVDKNGEADDAAFYRYAQIPRATWSHLRLWSIDKTGRQPGKETLLKIVVALRLNAEEANALLKKASNSLNGNDYRDRIIMACLSKKIYDPAEVYEILKFFSDGGRRFDNIYKGWEREEQEEA